MPDLANTLIGGRYRLERHLGAGGMGEVWAATDTRLDRPVALKILRSGSTAEPGVRLRFESEARSAARLHHPNVVAVFDAGVDADDGAQLWLVMERLPGLTLVDRMARGQLSPTEARAVAIDVLNGLAAAHRAMLVHRDIKPSNLLQAADGTWKVADFGIAKPLDAAIDLTATGATIGTPSYLSPEQLEGRPATPASDLWAVGVVLYEALAGRKPFNGETPFAIAHAVRTADPEPIAAIRPDVDLVLSTTISSALAKDPDKRPRDASTMAAMLRAPATSAEFGAPGQEATVAPVGVPPTTVFSPARSPGPAVDKAAGRRRSLGWIAASAVVLAALLIAAVAIASRNDDSPGKLPTTTTPSTTAANTTATPRSQPGTTAPATFGSTTPSSSTTASTTSAPSTTSSTTTTSTTTSTTAPGTTSTTTKPKKGKQPGTKG